MPTFPPHLFDEPAHSVDTLGNLGPLRALAGSWRGTRGGDDKPTADGSQHQQFIEHYVAQPIDPQLNGPQLLYGLRYHTHIVKPGEVEMYHDQVGYFLWEPATGTVMQTLTIPRGQCALAIGQAAPDATSFTLTAQHGSTANGIVSGPFLEQNFRTDHFTVTFTVHDEDHWSYSEQTRLLIKGVPDPFSHADTSTLHRIGPAHPNPLQVQARQAQAAASKS